jgi:hypothetical protein
MSDAVDALRGRFPRTPHLVNGPLSGKAVARDDLTLSAADADLFIFRDGHGPNACAAEPGGDVPIRLVVEEKLDGANLGFGLAADGGTILAQNRSHHVNGATAPQWAGMPRFLDETKAELLSLFYALPDDPRVQAAIKAPLNAHSIAKGSGPGGFGQPPVAAAGSRETAAHPENPACDWLIFGEWLAYQHSVFYDKLPSPFVVFDLYHAPSQRFLSAGLRNSLVEAHCPSLVTSRCIYSGPLEMRPTGKAANKPAKAGAKKGGATTVGINTAPVPEKVTSWDDFHNLWHHRESGFFAGHGDKARTAGGDAAGAAAVRHMEGAVLRVDDAAAGFQLMRCKAVHDEFVAAIDEHWRKQALVKNIVALPTE